LESTAAGRAEADKAKGETVNMELACVTDDYVKSFNKGDSGFVKGDSSLVQLDADNQAQDRGRALSDRVLAEMDAWLKELRCAQGCDIDLIYVGPPSATPSSGPVYGTGRHRIDVLGYSWTVSVVGTLIVGCHKPNRVGTPHKPGTGLPGYEPRREKRKSSKTGE
jgi:hypothetical protein